MLLAELSESPVRDAEIRRHPEAMKHYPKLGKKDGFETSLQKVDGLPVYIWYYRTMANVYWHSTRDYFVLEAPLSAQENKG